MTEPEAKEPSMERQSVAGKAIRNRGAGKLLDAQKILIGVRPTELRPALVVGKISARAVRAEDAGAVHAQQAPEYFGTAALGHGKGNSQAGDKGPKPTFFPIAAPAGFIGTDDGLAGQLALDRVARCFEGPAGFFDVVLDAAGCDRDIQYRFEQVLDLAVRVTWLQEQRRLRKRYLVT